MSERVYKVEVAVRKYNDLIIGAVLASDDLSRFSDRMDRIMNKEITSSLIIL